jgi:hypothetical protein
VTWRGSISFVSGSKNLKVGYQGSDLGDLRSANRGSNALRYRFNNGVPNQLTMFVNDFQNDLWMRDDAPSPRGNGRFNGSRSRAACASIVPGAGRRPSKRDRRHSCRRR